MADAVAPTTPSTIVARALYDNMAEALRRRRLEAAPPHWRALYEGHSPPCSAVHQGLAMYAALRVEGMLPSEALRTAAQHIVEHVLGEH